MPWWGWLIAGLTLAAGLDLVVQWVWVRLRPPPTYDNLVDCPRCGTTIPRATWRCYRCRKWIRRRGSVLVLSILQFPAFLGGLVLLILLLAFSAIAWAALFLVGPLTRSRPVRTPARWLVRAWRTLLSPVRRLWGRKEKKAFWRKGGERIFRFRIPVEGGNAGGQIGILLETMVGGREVPGAWRGAVVWLREPDAVVTGAFLAVTHLTEAGSAGGWVDRGTFHRVVLHPVREWVGWRGTRQDLEALGDLYLSIPGGVGLVAIGTGDDRPPVEWGPERGDSPPAWLRLETFSDGGGWSAVLHWNLSYDPAPAPPDMGFSPR